MRTEESFRDLPDEPYPDVEHIGPALEGPRIEDLEEEIRVLEQSVSSLTGPAWDQISEMLEAERAHTLGQLVNGPLTAEQLWQVRGRVQALEWMLMRPRFLTQELELRQEQLSEITDQGGT